MREMLLGAAEAGFFTPLWSARILEEWARAAGRGGAQDEARERALIAALALRFPGAEVAARRGEAGLWLPDPGDLHVLACALDGQADVIVTLNARDFPRGELAMYGLGRADPDAFLLGFAQAQPARMRAVAQAVHQRAQRDLGAAMDLRALLKRARLPRLGKAMTRDAGL